MRVMEDLTVVTQVKVSEGVFSYEIDTKKSEHFIKSCIDRWSAPVVLSKGLFNQYKVVLKSVKSGDKKSCEAEATNSIFTFSLLDKPIKATITIKWCGWYLRSGESTITELLNSATSCLSIRLQSVNRILTTLDTYELGIKTSLLLDTIGFGQNLINVFKTKWISELMPRTSRHTIKQLSSPLAIRDQTAAAAPVSAWKDKSLCL